LNESKPSNETYNQSTILFIYRILLIRLEAGSTVYPDGDEKIRTYLILDGGVPGVVCKFAHRMGVCVISPVSNFSSSLQNRLQLVFDFFKRSVVVSAWALARDV
jgi:hypothetical protein